MIVNFNLLYKNYDITLTVNAQNSQEAVEIAKRAFWEVLGKNVEVVNKNQ